MTDDNLPPWAEADSKAFIKWYGTVLKTDAGYECRAWQAALAYAREAVERDRRWRPIAEAPKDGAWILGIKSHTSNILPGVRSYYCIVHWDEDGEGKWGWEDYGAERWGPSHFMPLPEPPQ